MNFKHIALLTTLAGSLILNGCNDPKSKTDSTNRPAVESNTLKVGVINGAEQELAEFVKEQTKEKYNIDVDLVIFNDYVTPNQALNDGLLDINQFQHKPYLDEQIKERHYKLTPVANTFVYPIAAYSYKLKPITDVTTKAEGVKVTSPKGETFFIPAGASIAIPNDPTNLGRSLLLLQQQGLIKVNSEKGLLPTVLDITDNPFNYKIIELEAPQLPRSLNDPKVDLAIINTSYSSQIGLTPTNDGIFLEDKDSPYVNIIVSRTSDINNESIKKYIKSFQTAEVEKKANEIFNGGAIKGW